ncbi:MAG: DUF3883 domain-containing protein [Candidatus Omnitrophica bacterium]|nr:DUF3883 domain-containing protein [Candidatus Omnitrophota bacterium]
MKKLLHMKDYLVINKISFKKISLKQILIICEIINSSSLLSEEFLRKRFLKKSMHFKETLDFLGSLGLILYNQGNIQLSPNFRILLSKTKDANNVEQKIKKFLINIIFKKKLLICKPLYDFLVNFKLNDGKYLFRPTPSQRYKFSDSRNFLMELGVIELTVDQKSYILSSEYLELAEIKNKRKITLKEFLKNQKANEEIGKAAELEVLKYERRKLFQFPALVKKIEYVSSEDVSAGYDIISFDESSSSEIYIEVKAVASFEHKFYWSRNEIEKAKFLRGQYYLYLLPHTGKKEFRIEYLKIVRDPFINIYENKEAWERTQEALSFYLKLPH